MKTDYFANRKIERLNRKLDEEEKARQNSEKKYLIIMTFSLLYFCATVLLAFLLLTGKAHFLKEIARLKAENISLRSENASLTEENKNLSQQYNGVTSMLAGLSDIAWRLDQDNESLKGDNLSMQEQINDFREREELYDKYEWSLYKENGSRTDITYENLKDLKELTREKGMSEETVDLVLALAMTESKGNELAENKISSAVGYGQFLTETGKFVYTSLMGNNSYDHFRDALDGTTNLKMMVEYLDYLNNKYDGNLEEVLIEYRGKNDASWMEKVDGYLSKTGKSIKTLSIR